MCVLGPNVLDVEGKVSPFLPLPSLEYTLETSLPAHFFPFNSPGPAFGH